MQPLANVTPIKRAGAIQVQNVGQVFKTSGSEVTALADVSLDIKPGRFVVLVGPSGCGKSTILNMVSGLMPPTEGEIVVDGRTLRNVTRDVGYVTQQPNLMPWRSLIDNVAFPLEIAGIGVAERHRRARELIKLVGLGGFEHARPGELSGGMRQRANIIRTMIYEPKVILMDEPFGPLDAQTRQIMGNLLLDLWSADRKAVLFVTHDLEEAIALADRVVIMSAGPSARIIGDWRVPLPRPRDITEVRLDKAFHDLHREIWDALKDEVMKGYAQSTKIAG